MSATPELHLYVGGERFLCGDGQGPRYTEDRARFEASPEKCSGCAARLVRPAVSDPCELCHGTLLAGSHGPGVCALIAGEPPAPAWDARYERGPAQKPRLAWTPRQGDALPTWVASAGPERLIITRTGDAEFLVNGASIRPTLEASQLLAEAEGRARLSELERGVAAGLDAIGRGEAAAWRQAHVDQEAVPWRLRARSDALACALLRAGASDAEAANFFASANARTQRDVIRLLEREGKPLLFLVVPKAEPLSLQLSPELSWSAEPSDPVKDIGLLMGRLQRKGPRSSDAEQAWREVKEGLERERLLRAQLAVVQTPAGGVWYWEPDGQNDPASLSCPVVMSAETLREMLAGRGEAMARAEAEREARIAASDLREVEAVYAGDRPGVVPPIGALAAARERLRAAEERLPAGGTAPATAEAGGALLCPWGCGHATAALWDFDWSERSVQLTLCPRCGKAVDFRVSYGAWRGASGSPIPAPHEASPEEHPAEQPPEPPAVTEPPEHLPDPGPVREEEGSRARPSLEESEPPEGESPRAPQLSGAPSSPRSP